MRRSGDPITLALLDRKLPKSLETTRLISVSFPPSFYCAGDTQGERFVSLTT